MSSFGERFSVLRKSVNLNRVQIAKKIGVKSTMVDRIENEQSFPRADVVQKIAEFFPDKILWLLTDDFTTGSTQTAPKSEVQHGIIRIIDEVDPRWCEKMKIKTQFLDQLIVIQTSEWNVLGGIFIVKDKIYSNSDYPYIRQGIFVQAGHLNFQSTHGGMMALETFRNWVNSNRPDLLLTAEIKTADISIIKKMKAKAEIYESDLHYIANEKDEDNILFQTFQKWVAGEEWVETPRRE